MNNANETSNHLFSPKATMLNYTSTAAPQKTGSL